MVRLPGPEGELAVLNLKVAVQFLIPETGARVWRQWNSSDRSGKASLSVARHVIQQRRIGVIEATLEE